VEHSTQHAKKKEPTTLYLKKKSSTEKPLKPFFKKSTSSTGRTIKKSKRKTYQSLQNFNTKMKWKPAYFSSKSKLQRILILILRH
jgi:hypothetical protein